jgi:hypothetical protein
VVATADRTSYRWVVIHPLDDVPEIKVDVSALGPMKLTLLAKIALGSLRVYLVLMLALVLYDVVKKML